MIQVYDSQRRCIRLSAEIGRGGESAIYRIEGQRDVVAKIYATSHIAIYEQKLAWMLAHPPQDPTAALNHASLAWPQTVLYNRDRAFCGYVMPLIHDAVTLLKAFNPRLRMQTLPTFDRRYLHRTAQNLAAALASLHACDYVIGDLHESNVMVTPRALVTLIDTDSFQVEVTAPGGKHLYPCLVGKPEYTPPELQGQSFQSVKRLPEHDYFGLTVLIFQLLMEGNHPFRGQWQAAGDPPPLEEKIRRGLFPYSAGARGLLVPPPTGLDLDSLHPELARLVRRCFKEGHTQPRMRPKPDEWIAALSQAEAALTQCHSGHYYSNHLAACPMCRVHTAPRRQPQPVAPPVRRAPPVSRAPTAPPPLTAGPSTWTPPPPRARSGRRPLSWQWTVFALVVGLLMAIYLPRSPSSRGGRTPTPIPIPTYDIFEFYKEYMATHAPTSTRPRAAARPPLSVLPTPTPFLLNLSVLPTPDFETEMVYVPAGSFEMGRSGQGDAQPVHLVTLDAFYIDKYEVTNRHYRACMDAGACAEPHCPDGYLTYLDTFPLRPVTCVNWQDAQAFCAWRKARLPTEAEWDRVKISPKHREGGQNSGNLLMLSGECAKGRNKRPRASLTWPKSNQQASRELHVQTW